MDNRRQQKVAGEIQRTLSDIFQRNGASYYGRAFVTISAVKVSPDLSNAKVYLSIYNIEDKQAAIDGIQLNAPDIRRRLGNSMKNQLRIVPEFDFFLDESLDEVFKLEQIFKDIKDGKK